MSEASKQREELKSGALVKHKTNMKFIYSNTAMLLLLSRSASMTSIYRFLELEFNFRFRDVQAALMKKRSLKRLMSVKPEVFSGGKGFSCSLSVGRKLCFPLICCSVNTKKLPAKRRDKKKHVKNIQ